MSDIAILRGALERIAREAGEYADGAEDAHYLAKEMCNIEAWAREALRMVKLDQHQVLIDYAKLAPLDLFKASEIQKHLLLIADGKDWQQEQERG